MRIVVALGGNALLRRGEVPESEVQRRRVRPVARAVAALAAHHEVLVVHGNGPQVGLLAMETEADPRLSRPFPLGDLVAESQGLIGSWIQQELLSHDCPATALVTQVVVDGDDPAFSDPSKPIGGTYDEATARRLAQQRGWTVRPDGEEWRRVVPSPRPLEVVDLDAARVLVQAGRVVVVGGGGGVPVLREGRAYAPVEAVVDKDLVAGLVADGVAADLLVVLTDVEGVIDGFGTPQAQVLPRATPEELRSRQFAAGSMGPKVEACARFVEGRRGRRAVIAALESLALAVDGAAGTQIVDATSRE
ncbi:carbamate kinase [Nocardioides daphniae]|uniref:Carbamate kinase n=1 Tax=Nocardioides daphniae TaxID=402297 RepID=A0A4P7UDU4_9ACTN|nr:carbamate kinase [Nocardioides daphniae]QCC77518.1 carbamate kinase [Nocardioides daphniae]GGD31186.1 carbamate kinase [Nocardioides daphniae]